MKIAPSIDLFNDKEIEKHRDQTNAYIQYGNAFFRNPPVKKAVGSMILSTYKRRFAFADTADHYGGSIDDGYCKSKNADKKLF